MSVDQELYGLDATEVIIRIKGEDVNTFNQLNELSIDQVKTQLAGKEIECYFQKVSEEEHRIIAPLTEGFLMLIVSEHKLTSTYEAIVSKKLKTVYTSNIILPDTDRIIETCAIRIIDINEGGRNNLASDEFYELQKKISRLPIASVVNIGNQQAIWNKWIEAQRIILGGLQEMYEVKGSYEIDEIRNKDGDIASYRVKFPLANPIPNELDKLELKLRELKVRANISDDGEILLTKREIEILDAVIERDFNESIEREEMMIAFVPVRPSLKPGRTKDRIPAGISAKYNEYKGVLSVYGKIDDSISATLANAGFNYKSTTVTFEIINHGDIVQNETINKKYAIIFGGKLIRTTGKSGYLLPMPKNNKFVITEREAQKLKWTQDGLSKIYGSSNVLATEAHLYEPGEELLKPLVIDEDKFWIQLTADLYPHNLERTISIPNNAIFLQCSNEEELKKQVEVIRKLHYVQIIRSPFNENFKFKVHVKVDIKKSEQELFLQRLKMLKGAEFITEVPVPGSRKPRLQFLGSINARDSDNDQLILNLPNIYPPQKIVAKNVIKYLNKESRAVIKEIRANLTGDITKVEWLQIAVNKATQPDDAPNGKPVNAKLGDFIFDTSKADPIFDERKLDENSEEYQLVKANELLKLNETQRKAVLSSINCPDLALLQGPPGTGKTTVIAEMIWQIISRDAKHKILVTSESNLAVDNALDRLLNTKGVNTRLARYTTIIKPLRFGKMNKMDEEGAKYSAERIGLWSGIVKPKVKEAIESDEEDGEEKDGVEVLEKKEPELNLENNAVQDWMSRIASRANYSPKYAAALKDWTLDLEMPTMPVREVFAKKYFQYSNVVGSTCTSCGSPNFMWDYSRYMLGNDPKNLNELNYYARTFPLHRKFANALASADIPDELKSEYSVLESNFQMESDSMRRYFANRSEDAEVSAEAFPTIDNKPVKSANDTERLVSFVELVKFSTLNFARYFEETVKFDTVIMDEASKATPPELLLPLCFGNRSIVIGDHRQLPPMLNEKDFKEALKDAGADSLSNEIDKEFTETSQFERMILNPKVSPTIISRCNIQYRMHPDINEVIKQFYLDEGGLNPAQELLDNADINQLSNHFSRHHGFYLEGLVDPSIHTIWVNVTTPETKEGTSVTNNGEVQAINMVIQLLKKANGFNEFQKHWDVISDKFKRQQEQQIGVISFYGAQKNQIKRSLERETIPLKIDTVDRFQGMERNIIIVSTVRSNTKAKGDNKTTPNIDSGFAKSPQRLNVALSRARRLLIVVGNKDFFEGVTDKTGRPLYKNAISAIERKGRIIDYETLKNLAM